MDERQRELALRYQPRIAHDSREPFPIRYMGCTVFTQPRRSDSFPKWLIDPKAEGARAIIEYAVYYDYDIQHMYDLEHVWVAVDEAGGVADCWSSFHGMRLRASGVPSFRVEGTHPVLYAQPGKHAMLPDPALFGLIPNLREACTSGAGGGLLIPGFLAGEVETSDALDARIARHIREHYAFAPSMAFERETVKPEQIVGWPELLAMIPRMIREQIAAISA